MAGRRTKLTPETGDTIAAAISLGLSFKEAAQLAGIDETTLHRWRNRGRDSGRQPFRQFCQRIDAAQASTARDYLQAVRRSVIEPTVTTKTTTRPGPDGQPVVETVETVEAVSPPDIKGALWWLERRLPALFGRGVEHADSIDSTHDRENQRPLELLIVDPMTPQEAAAYDLEAQGEGLGRPEHADTAAAAGG